MSDTGVYKRPKTAQAGAAVPSSATGLGARDSAKAASALEALAALAKESADDRRKNGTAQTVRREAAPGGDMGKGYEEIKAGIRELKSLFSSMARAGGGATGGGFSGEWAVLFNKLVDAEVPADAARALVARMQGQSPLQGADVVKGFVTELTACFQGPAAKMKTGKPGITMFVGPTGMGKTTTLAKLAAYHVLNKRKSVSVITADTYRIAAIEQIRTFTDIMGLPLHIVFSPEESCEALAACAASDLVLVDTAGRSQKSAEHMQDLSALIEAMRPDEIHLVLSAGTKVSDLNSAIERYRPLGVNKLLFTKLDETMKLGNVLTVAVESKIPFSYFTFGQRVPDDIELAQPQGLAQRLFEGSAM
jgi:flagellar biosynthesis protein FlhF